MRCRYHVAQEMRPRPLPRRFLLNREIEFDDRQRQDFECPVPNCPFVATMVREVRWHEYERDLLDR